MLRPPKPLRRVMNEWRSESVVFILWSVVAISVHGLDSQILMCSTGWPTFVMAHWLNSPFFFLQPKSLHRHTLSSRWPATPADWSATAVNCCLRNSPGNSTHDRRLHRGHRSSPYNRVQCFWAAVVYSRLRCHCPYRWRQPIRGNQMNSKRIVAVACFGCHVVLFKVFHWFALPYCLLL